MAPAQPAPVRNRLLTSLPADVLALLLPKLTHVDMPMAQQLYRADGSIEAVYFPDVGMISLVADLDDGMRAEVGLVGYEGMLGLPLLSGTATSFTEAMVQNPGTAWRMPAHEFRRELDANAPLRQLLLRYSEAFQAQVTQTAACNSRHGLEQRLARWLLMAHDRADSDTLPLTQDFISMMLGVHRPSITVTAGILQRAGLIRYAQGKVTVLDRSSLEAASCECHTAVKRRFEALLGTPVG